MEKIGPYEIIRLLGKGGMADVYLAFDPKLEREVAVKVLSDELSGDPEFQRNFEREAKTIARLEYAEIVPVYDFGTANGKLYLVMRHMKGRSLRDRLRKGQMSLDEINYVLKCLANGLDKVHDNRILHRDIKPGNILFDTQANPYLSDFGIARSITSDNTAIEGTHAFMSPEQFIGKSLDPKSDIYSLGVTLFNMLTGHPNLRARDSIHRYHPNLSPDIENVLNRALAKKKEDRYATAKELAEAFDQVVENSTDHFRLHFANRDLEKKTIRAWLEGHLYVQIYGPSGLGKTYLMQQIERELRADKWYTIWMGFKGEEKGYVANRFAFLDSIYKELDDATDASTLTEDQLLEKISIALAQISQPVILLIDDADVGIPKVLKWIREVFLYRLTQNWNIEGVEGKNTPLYVLAAGQQVIIEWQGYKRGRPFKELLLSEFDDSLVLEEIINEVILRSNDRQVQGIKAVDGEEWQVYLDEIVKGLLDISCGHPLVIAEILHYAVKQYWLADPTCFIQHRYELYERCLAPIVDGHILLSVDRTSGEAFRSLCIFRYVWPDLIRELTDDKILEELGGPWEPFSEGRKRWFTWWSLLEDTHLVQPYEERFVFILSPVVRKVVSIVLCFENEPLYRAKHRRAQNMYQSLLIEEIVPAQQKAAYIFEYFYHTIESDTFTQVELTTTLTQALMNFLQKMKRSDLLHVGPQFLKWFRSDTELANIFEKIVPGLYGQLGQQAYHFIEDAKGKF